MNKGGRRKRKHDEWELINLWKEVLETRMIKGGRKRGRKGGKRREGGSEGGRKVERKGGREGGREGEKERG